MKQAHLLILIMATLLACQGEKPQERFIRTSSRFIEGYDFHPPTYFIDLFNSSKIKYTFVDTDRPLSSDLSRIAGKTPDLSPFLVRRNQKNAEIVLEEELPSAPIKALFTKALSLAEKQQYEETLALYQKALTLNPTYFKTYTNIGDAFFLLGKYQEAKSNFLKAIEFNEIGFQEYWFLADTVFRLEDKAKALEYISTAYMLNKNDPRIQETLDLILHSQKLKLRPNRLMFPFSIIVENKQAVQINIVAPEGKNWYPLVNCLVAWEMEAEFIKIRSEFKDSILIELLKYKEAFTSQYRFVQKRLKEKQEISEKERWLYQVIDKGFLSEFILWEIIASARPNIILLLPADKRQRIIDYLYQFVYEPAK